MRKVATLIILCRMKQYIMIIWLVLVGLVVASGQGYSLEERLLEAAGRGYIERVKLLHKNGVDINYQNSRGWTALMWASSNGYIELVEYLIDAGAEVNAKNKYGRTALMMASSWLSGMPREGRTALILAKSEGHTEIIKILKEAGATE